MAIPRRYSHFLFGLIQSGFTTAIAAAIASAPLIHDGVLDFSLGDNDTVCPVSYSTHP
jgi:hypothetical protein